MRLLALIPALYLTSTLCACAQPMPDGPPPGYGQSAPQGGYGQGAPGPGQGPQGWAGGMQAYNGQTPPPDGMAPDQAPPGAGMGGPGMGGPGMGAPEGGRHEKFAAKFAAANVTRDGRLTQQQAQAGGMHAVAKHFAQIDRDQKGYVTLQDIKEWHRAMHAEKAARAQGAAPGAGSYPPPAPPPGAAPAGGQQY
jgi:hypothetical protein